MANKHETLASLFTDTADAIREKTGTSEKIIADNFPDVIREISVGIDTSDATIEAAEVMNGEIAYGADGKIIGIAPFELIEYNEKINLPHFALWGASAEGENKSIMVATEDLSGPTNLIAISEDGINWENVELPISAFWSSVAYGNGKFVIIAYSNQDGLINTALCSEDGVNWVQSTLPIAAEWTSITYGNGKFIAIARVDETENPTNIAAYSEDGVNWTQITLPISACWGSITYGNNKFIVTAGEDENFDLTNIIIYSEDGINWNTGELPIITGPVTYNNGKFIIIPGGEGNLIVYSEDGINWNVIELSVYGYWNSACFKDNKFIVGGEVYHEDGSMDNRLICLDNNFNQTQIVLPAQYVFRLMITYINNKFITVISTGDDFTGEPINIVGFSKDGINWTYEDSICYQVLKNGIYLNNDNIENRKLISTETDLKFEGDFYTQDATIKSFDIMKDEIAYGTDGKIIGTAPFECKIEKNYTLGLPVKDIGWKAIVYGDKKFVSVTTNYFDNAAYSEDGINWTETKLPSAGNWNSIAYGNGKFVTLSNKKVAYSEDGITWMQAELPITGTWAEIIYGNDKFIAISNTSTNQAIISEDGINWTVVELPVTKAWKSVAYGNGKFVAIYGGRHNQAAISTDGITWEMISIPSSAYWEKVAYCNDKLIICGTSTSSFVYSTDGVKWIKGYFPSTSGWCELFYANNKYIAFSSSKAAYSENGINWTEITLPRYGWTSIAYGDNKFIAVGAGGNKSIYSEDGINWYDTYQYNNYKALDESMYLTNYNNNKIRKLINTETELKFEDELNISDATISKYDVMKDKIAYGPEGQITGVAPFKFNNTESELSIFRNITTAPNALMAYGNGQLSVLNSVTVCSTANGSSWGTEITLPVSAEWQSFTYIHDKFFAIPNDSNIAICSTNTVKWYQITLPVTGEWNITYDNNKFIAIAYNSNMAGCSSDGINWTWIELPVSGRWLPVTYGNGKFVAIASHSNVAIYSTDGITWTQTTLPFTGRWENIIYGNNVFVAIDGWYHRGVIYSQDGINWFTGIEPWYDCGPIMYGNGKFISIGNESEMLDTQIICSTDGINWTMDLPPFFGEWEFPVFGNNKFIAYSSVTKDKNDNYINANIILCIDENGSYIQSILPIEGYLYFMTYGNDTFIGLTSNNEIIYSKDCVDWKKLKISTDKDFYYGDFIFGNDAIILFDQYSYALWLINKEMFYYKALDEMYLSNNRVEPRKLINNGTNLKFEGDFYTQDANALNYMLSKDEIAYNKDGQIVGVMPIEVNPFKEIKLSSDDLDVYWRSIVYGDNKFVAISDPNLAVYSTDGIIWNKIEMPISEDWNSIAYGDGKFVAITYNGPVAAYSKDGINWTQIELPGSEDVYWGNIVYGNGKFVIPGTGCIIYSTDGINWTKISLSYMTSGPITYGNGKFVAIANYYDATGAYSTDGINWIKTTLPVSRSWRAIAYGNGKFIAIPSNLYASDAILYSEDGINWTQATLPRSIEWNFITYGNGKFVAVGDYHIVYSEDGLNWNEPKMPISKHWQSVAYGNNKFVLIDTYDRIVLHSEDGVNWVNTYTDYKVLDEEMYLSNDAITKKLISTETELRFEGDYTTLDATIESYEVMNNEIAYGVDGKIIGAAPFEFIEYKPANWNTIELPLPNSYDSIVYGNGKFIAIGNGNISIYSEDGVNWNSVTLPVSARWQSIAYGNDKFVTVAKYEYINSNLEQTNKILYSSDGINWNIAELPISNNWDSIIYGNDKFIAISSNSELIVQSEDGINWNTCELPLNKSWHSIAYGNDKFIIVSNDQSNQALSSEDGINWSIIELPTTTNWGSITYGNNKFVAVSSNGNKSIYSEDGINWTQTELPAIAAWEFIICGNGKFIALPGNSATNISAYSEDGINWEKIELPISRVWSSIAYGNNKFIATNAVDNIIAQFECTSLEYKILSAITLSADGCESRKLIIKDNKIMFEDETNFTVRDDGAGNLTISGMTVIDSNGNVTIGG